MTKTSSYCVKCRQITQTKNPTIEHLQYTTKYGKPIKRLVLKGLCDVCQTKKTKFISNQEGHGLLSMLGIKTPLAKIPIIGPILG